MSYIVHKAQARSGYDHNHNKCLGFYDLKNIKKYTFSMNPNIEIRLLHSFTIVMLLLLLFFLKILFEDCLHCIAFLNE